MPERIVVAPLFFVFGSLLGSFCNVVVLRTVKNKSVIFPPSSCPQCNHRLSAVDLMPIFGWILLLGRCRYCKASISVQYPLVEAFVASVLTMTFMTHGFSPQLIPVASWAVIFFVSSLIYVRDESDIILPQVWALSYCCILGFWAAWPTPVNLLPALAALPAGILVALPSLAAGKPSRRLGGLCLLACSISFSLQNGITIIAGILLFIGITRASLIKPDTSSEPVQARITILVTSIAGIIWGINYGFWGLSSG